MKSYDARVSRSQELGFYVSEFPLEVMKTFDVNALCTMVDFEVDCLVSKGVAALHFSVEVTYGEGDSLLGHNCIVEFQIGDMRQLVDADGQLPVSIWMDLIYETYALVRGMIAVRTLGFGIHDYPLPFLTQERVLARLAERIEAKLPRPPKS